MNVMGSFRDLRWTWTSTGIISMFWMTRLPNRIQTECIRPDQADGNDHRDVKGFREASTCGG